MATTTFSKPQSTEMSALNNKFSTDITSGSIIDLEVGNYTFRAVYQSQITDLPTNYKGNGGSIRVSENVESGTRYYFLQAWMKEGVQDNAVYVGQRLSNDQSINWNELTLSSKLQKHGIGTFTTVAECKQAIINYIVNIPTLNCVSFQVNGGTESLPEPFGNSTVFAIVIPIAINTLGDQNRSWFQMIATSSTASYLAAITYRGNNVFYYNDSNGHSGTF